LSKLAPPNDLANEPSLVESAQRAKDAGLPDIAVSPLQGQFLSILVKGMGASKVLEIGTLWG
jgi:predicted O-methyltransferase YrrM